MKRNIIVSLLLVLLLVFVVSCEEPKHEHTLEKVDAVAATCSEEGMSEYYQCSVCKLTFADKEAKTEVKDLATLKTAKDPANHSDVKKVDAVESTCTVNGTVEHWHCEGCGKNYSDKTCKSELKTLEASLKAHETEMVKAVAATCVEEGMSEYYQCSVCKLTFADKEAKTEVKDLATLKTDKDPANHTELKKTEAVAATCDKEGNIEYYHCSGCDGIFSDVKGTNPINSVVLPRHSEGDVVATGETFTVGEIEYSIYKCNHNNYFIDKACTERLYKDYFDAAGLVVTEKDGVLDAYFSDCDVFMSTEAASSYGFTTAAAYFTDKKYTRLGYNKEHVNGLDATENKALTLTATKDEEESIQITGGGPRMPLNDITSITLNGDKTGLVMVANGGETWNLTPYNNPVRGTYTDSAGNILTFGRSVMKYTYSGEEAFYVVDNIDGQHIHVANNETNSGSHGDTTFGHRQFDFLGTPILYIRWKTNLVDKNGVKLATFMDAGQYYTYTPVSEE